MDLTTTLLGFVKPMLIIGVACGLLIAEPDYGAAVVLMIVSLGVLFFGGARLRDFTAIAVLASCGLTALVFVSPERMERVTAFLDPWGVTNIDHGGYQLTQSLIAIVYRSFSICPRPTPTLSLLSLARNSGS